MKLTIDFHEVEKSKPSVCDDLIVITPKTWWIIENYNGELLQCDITHWGKIDMKKLDVSQNV